MKEINRIYKILESYNPRDEYYTGLLSKTYGNAKRTKYVLYISLITGFLLFAMLYIFFMANPEEFSSRVFQCAFAVMISLSVGVIWVALVNSIFCKELPRDEVAYLNRLFRDSYTGVSDRQTCLVNSGKKLLLVDKGRTVYSTEYSYDLEMYNISIEKYYEVQGSGIALEIIDCVIKYGNTVLDTVNLEGRVYE